MSIVIVIEACPRLLDSVFISSPRPDSGNSVTISIRWVNQYILEGLVPGCERLGRSWAVPEDAVKPERQKPGVKKREREEKPS